MKAQIKKIKYFVWNNDKRNNKVENCREKVNRIKSEILQRVFH